VWTYLWINKTKTTMSIIGGVGTAYSTLPFLIASAGNEKQKSTHCRIHSKIQTKHRRKKGANSIPFNTQIHAN
jgi:hypothetical protein